MGETTSPRQGGANGSTTDTAETRRRRLGWRVHLPNQLTISRLFLSAVFFAVIILTNYEVIADSRRLALNASMALFILTAVTDFLDGFLARRWEIVSTFGRIADPIADKILICGAFVLLVDTCELVPSWFPVIIISREFLISGLRGFLESQGIAFGAGMSGKLKMTLQSVTIPVLLFYEANYGESVIWRWIVIGFLIATALLTVLSSIDYIKRAWEVLRTPRQHGPDPT